MKDLIWKNTGSKQGAFVRLTEQFPDAVCVAWYDKTRDLWKHDLAEKSPVEIKLASDIFPESVKEKTVIFIEHHLSLKCEEDILDRWRPLEIIILSSLDDDLFRDIKDSLVPLMEKMGMKEDEFLENAILSKAIKRKQRENDEKGIY